MEHEEAYSLMMDTLDGALTENGRIRLESHVASCADCARDWQALITIDTLFMQTEQLQPPPQFAAQTLARLTAHQQRRWLLGGLFALILVLGLTPLLAISWLDGTQLAPNLFGAAVQMGGQLIHLFLVVLAGCWQLIYGTVLFVRHNPLALAVPISMIGTIILWQAVLNQLVPGMLLIRPNMRNL